MIGGIDMDISMAYNNLVSFVDETYGKGKFGFWGSIALYALGYADYYETESGTKVPIPQRFHEIIRGFIEGKNGESSRTVGDIDLSYIVDLSLSRYEENPILKAIFEDGKKPERYTGMLWDISPVVEDFPENVRPALSREMGIVVFHILKPSNLSEMVKVKVGGKEVYVSEPKRQFARKVLTLIGSYNSIAQNPKYLNADFKIMYKAMKIMFNDEELLKTVYDACVDYNEGLPWNVKLNKLLENVLKSVGENAPSKEFVEFARKLVKYDKSKIFESNIIRQELFKNIRKFIWMKEKNENKKVQNFIDVDYFILKTNKNYNKVNHGFI